MQFSFIKCHGSGNDFPLIDARALSLSDAGWAGVARALADRSGPVGGDGLLLLTAGDSESAFGMRMFNSDGSEAETCLNGLRCTARLGFEVLGLEQATVRLKTSVAQVVRDAELAPGVTTIRTVAGPNSVSASDVGLRIDAVQVIDAVVPGLPSTRTFTAVAMPNPHLVTFVDQVDEAELVALGTWCEAGPALIPARANVSFVELRGQADLFVRTFERGVGLTDSCGSAMAASVLAAALTGRVPFDRQLRVFNKGGLVRAEASAERVVTISGNASFLYDASVRVDVATCRAEVPVMHARREDEADAWAAAVDALA
ncbi:diaminopimelate epimerase [Sphingomonas xinjiangensis]|uniref:Diaminopimelate epimerase n=1 Tax=Sphingomonas xinjiangensis TaxID=643568 RepID=A0A840YP45_9SPHN|nr:diaminopimelate epimerase [Sphingomonas xinjiangensis]MBB5711930.1 diaminopimelate epimerase [Sphingomonas xinjiangensis]